ncbi:MAG TPA: GAF domain-containing sensor histidine kinase [Gaiellaceae bacterium]
MSEVVHAIASERSLERVLHRLADAARELVAARYAAIGVPDGEGGFASFITSGMTDKQYDAIGELPRQHGLLGAMLESAEPVRMPDISQHERFEGWPAAHPNMRSFLGVPIVSHDEVIGAFYLTDKKGGRRVLFTDGDQQLIETFAAHAAVAIENARLAERSRELTVVEERNRLARDLHDAVNQSLFSVTLTADAAALLVDVDPERAKEQLQAVRDLARGAMDELRSVIFELRPGDVAADGLAETLRKHVDVLRRVHDVEIDVDLDGAARLRPLGARDAVAEREIFRIAQEAIGNALKHSGAEHVSVRLAARDHHVLLAVADDGSGFDPAGRQAQRRLGLVSMRERAEAIGGELSIESAEGAGTTVSLEVGLGGRDPRSDR